MLLGVFCQVAQAQSNLRLRDVNVRQQANDVLTLMSFTVVPDVTTCTLSINAASGGNPALTASVLHRIPLPAS